jgi:hypothetical protein
MKKLFFLFFISLLFVSNAAKAQVGMSCDSAFALTYVSPLSSELNEPDHKTTDSIYWYKFSALNEKIRMSIKSSLDPAIWKIKKAVLYGGTCTSLTQLGGDTLNASSDTTLTFDVDSLIPGATYYLAVTKGTFISCPPTGKCLQNDTAYYRISLQVQTNPCSSCTQGMTSPPCDFVCNGNFEFGNAPNGAFNINEACGWSNAGGGTCDYFSSSSTNFDSNIGCNRFGDEQPLSGTGYAGFGCTYSQGYFEYLKTTLTATMVPGQTYTVGLWLSRAEYTSESIGQLGVYFANSSFTQQANNGPLNLIPQLTLNGPTIPTSGWAHFTWSYVATGNEYYMLVGATTVAGGNPGCTTTNCYNPFPFNPIGNSCVAGDATITLMV